MQEDLGKEGGWERKQFQTELSSQIKPWGTQAKDYQL